MSDYVTYMDLRGRHYDLHELDEDERDVLDRLRTQFDRSLPWNEFENEWTREVYNLYQRRGVSPAAMRETVLYRVAQDLGSRLAVAQGMARVPDYRDELADLIRRRFKTRREFCQATGISEDMLSHVLARRKHLAIDTLSEALAKIGCTLQIVPLETTGDR